MDISRHRDIMERKINDSSEVVKKMETDIGEVNWEMTKQKEDLQFTQNFCDGIGKLINPIKEQVETLKVAGQELKEGGNKSDWGSISRMRVYSHGVLHPLLLGCSMRPAAGTTTSHNFPKRAATSAHAPPTHPQCGMWPVRLPMAPFRPSLKHRRPARTLAVSMAPTG